MLNFTHNNHLKYYFDNDLFGTRTTAYQKYRFEVGKVDTELYQQGNFQSELRRVADLVHHELGNEKVIFLSGGLDSEIVLRTFLDIGIKPRCITFKFENNYNDYEVNAAIETAKLLNVDLEIINFNIFDFYHSGEALAMAKKYSIGLLPYVIFLKVAEQLSAPSVIAGELHLSKYRDDNDKPVWGLRVLEDLDTSHIRFSQDTNIPFIQEWFSYTPELMLHFLETPEIKWLTSTPSYHQTILPVKNKIYRRLLPGLSNKIKNSGYDNLKGLFVESAQVFSENMPRRTQEDPYISYEDLVNILKDNHD
jgi:hypothetical protein